MSDSLFFQNPFHVSFLAFILYATGGALGALVKELEADQGILVLPRIVDGKLYLGGLTGLLLGSAAAVIADGNLLTAALSGYAAPRVIEAMAARRGPPAPVPAGGEKS